MALSEITLTGTLKDAGTSAVSGWVRFTPTAQLLDAGGDVVVPRVPVQVDLDGSGQFSTTLFATDGDADVTPDGVGYKVEAILNGTRIRPYLVVLDSTAGAVQDLADLPAAESSPLYSYLTAAQANAAHGDLQTSIDANATAITDEATARSAADALLQPTSAKGVASGYAALDADGDVVDAAGDKVTGGLWELIGSIATEASTAQFTGLDGYKLLRLTVLNAQRWADGVLVNVGLSIGFNDDETSNYSWIGFEQIQSGTTAGSADASDTSIFLTDVPQAGTTGGAGDLAHSGAVTGQVIIANTIAARRNPVVGHFYGIAPEGGTEQRQWMASGAWLNTDDLIDTLETYLAGTSGNARAEFILEGIAR